MLKAFFRHHKRADNFFYLFLALFLVVASLSFSPGGERVSALGEREVNPSTQVTFTRIDQEKPSASLVQEKEGELYSPEQAQRRDLEVQVKVSNQGSAASRQIRLEIPLIGDLDSPYQRVKEEEFSLEPVEIKNGEMANRTGVFEINNLPAGAVEAITISYEIEVSPLTADLNALHNQDLELNKDKYLSPSPKIEADHGDIVARAREVTRNGEGTLDKAQRIYRFVLEHMDYDVTSPYRNQGALTALQKASGVCEDYAALFTALCRASGIPARQVNGFTDPQGTGEVWNLSGGEDFSLRGYRHSWAEFYVEGLGWLPVDPTMDMYSQELRYFTSIPETSHIAQNYQDQSIRGQVQGGQVSIRWENRLRGH